MPGQADQQADQAQQQTPAPAPVPQADQQQQPVADQAGGKKLTQEQQGIIDRMEILEPHNHALLAKIIMQHPEIRDEIIAKANEVCGNDCVAKALKIVQNGGKEDESAEVESQQKSEEPPPPADAPKQGSKELDAILMNLNVLEQGDAKLLAKALHDHPQFHAEIVAEATKLLGDAFVQQAIALLEQKADSEPKEEEGGEDEDEDAPKKPARKKPPSSKAWAIKAVKYNDRHPAYVKKFNRLTRDACVGEDGKPDPTLVWKWQEKHGLTPDGMIGPNTLAAAQDARHGGQGEQEQDPQQGEQPPTQVA